jgi:ubiquinone/menaquinone biosynthesis C-methylase UbiE
MIDRHYADATLAELYDLQAPWGEPDDYFYIQLVMAVASVLDVGTGTGMLLRAARRAGHSGRVVGLDPAAPMLEVGRRDRPDVEWVHGDLSTVAWEDAFDLVVMTGHAFQVLLTDDDLRSALAAIRRALTDEGRFAFETRNPAARAWESWTPDEVFEIVTPDGGIVHYSRAVNLPVEGEFVSFTQTYASATWDAPLLSRSTLRFLDTEALATFLTEAGFEIEAQYGDWDRSPLTPASPEIITLARRATANSGSPTP